MGYGKSNPIPSVSLNKMKSIPPLNLLQVGREPPQPNNNNKKEAITLGLLLDDGSLLRPEQ